MKKIIVACDSLKGSLTSEQAAQAACLGIRSARPDAEVVRLSVADGGEGTARVITHALGGCWHEVSVSGPLRRDVAVGFGMVCHEGVRVAVVDMAEASGLTLIAPHERNPLITTSYGTGQLLAAACDAGCSRIIVGLGGSATNDAGKGMLEALGVRFLDARGQTLPDGGGALHLLDRIDISGARRDILDMPIDVMCDVDNPLCGPSGASAVYAPQKGATPEMVALLDHGLARFAEAARHATGRDVASKPGAGAAGGLGAAFMAFTSARMLRGADAVLTLIGFDRALRDADLVITGEGCIDRQTLQGKVPFGVLQRCRAKGVPVVAIAGRVADVDMLREAGFAGVYCINDAAAHEADVMDAPVAARNVARTCARIAYNLE